MMTPEEGEWPAITKWALRGDEGCEVRFPSDIEAIRACVDLARCPMVPEIPVTPEMVAAAVRLDASAPSKPDGTIDMPDYEWFAGLYRAMAALAPVELVTSGELAALRERDEARKSRAHWEEWFWDMSDRFDAAIDRWDSEGQTLRAQLAVAQEAVTRAEALARENARLLMTLAARDQAIAGLKSQLAARPDVVPDTPKATPNAFRDFPTDPRRIGA